MTIGELRKLIVGLDDSAEIEIQDESTSETYEVHEIHVSAYKGCERSYVKLVTNVLLQSETYVVDGNGIE